MRIIYSDFGNLAKYMTLDGWGGSKNNLNIDDMVNHDSEDGNKDTVHFHRNPFSMTFIHQGWDCFASCMNDYCLYRGDTII